MSGQSPSTNDQRNACENLTVRNTVNVIKLDVIS